MTNETTTDYDNSEIPGQKIDLDSYVIPEVTVRKTADEIEADGGGEDIEPGTYELECIGFAGAKTEVKDMYLDKQRLTMHCTTAWVRFCIPDDRSKQASMKIVLPPTDPDSYYAWANAATKTTEKALGYWGNTYTHLVERLFGVAIPKGNSLPRETNILANWKGKRIVATIVPPGTRTVKNADTGEDEEVAGDRNQIKLFSFKATNETTRNYKRPAAAATIQPGQAAMEPGQRAPRSNQPRPTGNGNGSSNGPARPPAQPQPQPDQMAILKRSLEAAVAEGDFAEAAAIQARMKQIQGPTVTTPPPNRGPVQTQRQPAMAGAADDRGLGNL